MHRRKRPLNDAIGVQAILSLWFNGKPGGVHGPVFLIDVET